MANLHIFFKQTRIADKKRYSFFKSFSFIDRRKEMGITPVASASRQAATAEAKKFHKVGSGREPTTGTISVAIAITSAGNNNA